MKNKVLAAFLAVTLAFCMMPVIAHASTGTVTDGNYTWGYATLSDNTCELTSFKDNGTVKSDITIPDKLTDGGTTYTVTQIGDAVNEVWVFQNNHDVKNVTVPEGITLIGIYAFGDTDIESITLPKSLRTICDYAFYQTEKLKTVGIQDNSVTEIGKHAFMHDTNLVNFTLPEGLKSIGDKAFESNPLTSVSIPASMISLGQNVFTATSLESISVESGNTHFTCEDGVLYDYGKTRLLMYLPRKTGSAYAVPDTVKSIDDAAFSCAAYLTSITLPKSVASIGEAAFAGCGITSLTIPDSVSDLKDFLFKYCLNLKDVTVLNPSAKFGNGLFYNYTLSGGLYGFAGSTAEKYASDNKITFHTLFKAVYNSNGGSDVDYGYAVSGGKLVKPADPKRSEYIFSGWYKDSSYKDAWNFDTDTLSVNTTLYAKWISGVQVAVTCKKTDVALYGGSTGSITISATGGGGGYKYSIDNGATWQASQSFSGLAAGTYSAAACDAENQSNWQAISVTVGQPPLKWTGLANKMPAKAIAGTAWVVKPASLPKGYTLKSVNYASSNNNIAYIDNNGNTTFRSGGSVKIKVTSVFSNGKKTKTVTTLKKIAVKQLAASIALNTTTAQLTVKKTLTLKVIFDPASATNKAVKWKSSNTKVATVSSKGVVTAKKAGTVIITCTAKDGSGKTATCTVTIS